MSDLYFYTTPADAEVVVTLDTGHVFVGLPCVANGREDAHRVTLPADTPTQGAFVRVTCAGYQTVEGRGILETDDDEVPTFIWDDYHLIPLPPPPEPPSPANPHQDPFAIIEAVYQQGDFDLSTKQGCGEYTEACVETLHASHSADWGHIRKTTAQNNWQGHAVDAIYLRWPAGETAAGVWDIVFDTESPNAEPSWSYKGATDPTLWYYGPMPCPPA
jgi:hypothetical protein